MIPGFKIRRGFTLAEVIISIFIGLMVIVLLANTFSIYQRTFRQAALKTELVQNARVALDLIARELRQAKELVTILPASASNPSLVPHELEFEDGHTQTQIQYIRYYLSEADLHRQIIIYHFESNPDIYVHYNDLDAFGAPEPVVLDDKIIGENFDQLDFYGPIMINIDMMLGKSGELISIKSVINPRNI